MKTVTIPNDYHPYEVEVNGKEYRFPAGATVSVPDEVAAVIENYYKLQPKEKPTDGGALPYVSTENNGDVLTVKDGAWTTGETLDGSRLVITVKNSKIDKTYNEIWEAISEDKPILVRYTHQTFYPAIHHGSYGSSIEFDLTGQPSDASGATSVLTVGSNNSLSIDDREYLFVPEAEEEGEVLSTGVGGRVYWTKIAGVTDAGDDASVFIALIEAFLTALGGTVGTESQSEQAFPNAFLILTTLMASAMARNGYGVLVVGDLRIFISSYNIDQGSALGSFSYIFNSHTYIVDLVINVNSIILHGRCVA